jgi:hypothetical protein
MLIFSKGGMWGGMGAGMGKSYHIVSGHPAFPPLPFSWLPD